MNTMKIDSWSGERTLNVTLKHDVSSIVFWTQMYGSNNMSENELRMSNVEVK